MKTVFSLLPLLVAVQGQYQFAQPGDVNAKDKIPMVEGYRCGSAQGGQKCPDGLCCSENGWCGFSGDHCSAGKCQAAFGLCTDLNNKAAGRCGLPFGNQTCAGANECCSVFGYCGSTSNYCANGPVQTLVDGITNKNGSSVKPISQPTSAARPSGIDLTSGVVGILASAFIFLL